MTTDGHNQPFPVLNPGQLPRAAEDTKWLIDKLWMHQSVGVIGAQPKNLKTYLALEMALSVATGTPCLGRFAVPHPGRVLVYAAEDCASTIRERLEGLARPRGIGLEHLDIGIIDTPRLRLDQHDMQRRLHATLARHNPVLLILDPIVRMHACDENSSKDVAALLGFLRSLQRHHKLALILVHHTRKSPAASPGHELRGSGDFFAWGDCFLYLSRRRERCRLTVEHRSAPAIEPLTIGLSGEPPCLTILQEDEPQQAVELDEAILALLASASAPMTTRQIQRETRVRTGRVLSTLHELFDRELVARKKAGWVRASLPVSPHRDHRERQRSSQLHLAVK
ncbi:MAG: AAA family ATPase [Pseudomonadota bacterium]